MSAKFVFTFLITCFCLNVFVLSEFSAYNVPIPLVTKDSCTQTSPTSQYYDMSSLECLSCPENTTRSSDGLSCKCKPKYIYVYNYGGGQVRCEACPSNQYASSTGYNCITCGTNVINNETNTCQACQAGVTGSSSERDLGGNWYDPNTSTHPVTCVECSADTQPTADGTRCEKCTNVLPVTGDNTCACTGTKINTGGFCFEGSQLENVNDVASMYEIPPSGTVSAYFSSHLRAAYGLCKPDFLNATACQLLGNLCVLTYYNKDDATTSACGLYVSLLGGSFVPKNMPWLYYLNNAKDRIDGDDILLETYLTNQYTFDPVSYLKYRVAKYSLDGKYLGLSNVLNGRLQLCADSSKKLNAAYVFGTTYKQMCSIEATELWDQTKYPTQFYDLYLEISQNGQPELYPVPVNVLNYLERSTAINRGSDIADYQLFRRFFLVDNVATVTTTGAPAEYVRYAKSITIDVQLQTDTTKGVIYPPTIKIEYAEVSYADAQNGANVDISFEVEYRRTDTSYKRDFQIAVGTLSTLGVIYAGYRTWVWSKRAGRPNIDFPTIVSFIFYCAGTLSNVFFVITFGIAFYFLVFFKKQNVVYLVHMEESAHRDWLGLFSAAFALKFLEVMHLVFMQCIVDVFFIDWERSKGVITTATDAGKTREIAVSIWRTYFVANEWNEIQAIRKINKIFQIFAVVFFLVVVGFENVATRDPNGQVLKDASNYIAEYSSVYRYGVAVCVYLVIGIVQWIFFTFIYERFVADRVRQFVDLCSMSNISVFVMENAQFGYYIHGRSVHGKADTNMREMFEMIKKEEDDMCGQRGLLPNTDQQTFIMSLPRELRTKYDMVLLPAQLEGAAAMMDQGRGGRIAGTAKEKQVEAYTTMNRFFSGFIDHGLRDIDYVIKDKTFLEIIMDTEFYDSIDTGIFYNDDGHAFDHVLFCGHEMTLLLFDILTFCITDYIFTNFVVAGVITYLMSELVCIVRDAGGQKNLAKKTLVDKRFLI